jgi:hypothetical protein
MSRVRRRRSSIRTLALGRLHLLRTACVRARSTSARESGLREGYKDENERNEHLVHDELLRSLQSITSRILDLRISRCSRGNARTVDVDHDFANVDARVAGTVGGAVALIGHLLSYGDNHARSNRNG